MFYIYYTTKNKKIKKGMIKVGNANLLEVARGAIGERLDYELSKVVDNIADLNTKADAVRKITLTLSLKPDSERQNIKMSTQVKSTLTPTNNIESALYLTESDEGKALVEMLPQVPGQMALDGSEQDEPKVIPIKKAM
jgi:hypothetical protein